MNKFRKLRTFYLICTYSRKCIKHLQTKIKFICKSSKNFIHSFLRSVVYLKTGREPLPKRVLDRVRAIASILNFQFLVFSLVSWSSCLLLLSHISFIFLYLFIRNLFRRPFLRKMWANRLVFLPSYYFIWVITVFLTVCNTSTCFTWSVQMVLPILLQHISKRSRYFWSTSRSFQVPWKYKAMIQIYRFTSFFLVYLSLICWRKDSYFWADLVSRAHLALFVTMLPKEKKIHILLQF
jgi:hypothetical protein